MQNCAKLCNEVFTSLLKGCQGALRSLSLQAANLTDEAFEVFEGKGGGYLRQNLLTLSELDVR